MLNDKQTRFILFWRGHDVDAAREAGYSNPSTAAKRLMSNAEVAECIERKRAIMIHWSLKGIKRDSQTRRQRKNGRSTRT